MRGTLEKVICNILDNIRLSVALALVIEFFSSLQIIHFIMKATFPHEHYHHLSLTRVLTDLTSLFGTFELLSISENNSTLMLLWFVLAIYLLIYVGIFAAAVILEAKGMSTVNQKLLKILGLLTLVHSKIVFLPIQYFFAKIIKLYTGCLFQGSNHFYCSKTYFGLSFVFLTISFLLTLAQEVWIYQITKNKNASAVKSNLIQQLKFLHKNTAILIYIFSLKESYIMLASAAINFILALAYLYILYIKLPFYNIKVLKMSIAMSATMLSLSIISVIRTLLKRLVLIDILIVILVPMFIKMSQTYINIIFERIIRGEFKSPEYAIHFSILIKKYTFELLNNTQFAKKNSFGALVANGILKAGEVEYDLKKDENAKEFKNKVSIYIAIRLATTLEQNPKSVPLILWISEIYTKKIKNIPHAYSLIKRLNSLHMLLPQRSSLISLKRKLEQIYSQLLLNTDTNLNISDYFKYRDIADLLLNDIKAELSLQTSFWTQIKSKKVDMKSAISIGYEIEILANKIQRRFRESKQQFTKHFGPILLAYQAYAQNIKERPRETMASMQRLLDSVTHHSNTKNILDTFGTEIAVVVTSFQKNQAEVILDASGSVHSFFDIERKSLIGGNLGLLLPTIFVKKHTEFIHKQFSAANTSIDNKYVSYGRVKDGDLLELEIQIQLNPSPNGEIQIMTIFKKLGSENPIIITGQSGTIIECSKSLRQSLQIQEENLSTTKVQELSSEFSIINIAFNTVYGKSRKQFEGLIQAKLRSTKNLLIMDDKFASNSLNILHDESTENLQSPLRLDEDHNVENSYINQSKKRLLDNQSARRKSFQTAKQEDSPSPNLPSTTKVGRWSVFKAFKGREPGNFGLTNIISNEKAQQICNDYNKGNKLRFAPKQLEIFAQAEIEYDAKVEAHTYNGEVHKVITLTKGEIKYRNVNLQSRKKILNVQTTTNITDKRNSTISIPNLIEIHRAHVGDNDDDDDVSDSKDATNSQSKQGDDEDPQHIVKTIKQHKKASKKNGESSQTQKLDIIPEETHKEESIKQSYHNKVKQLSMIFDHSKAYSLTRHALLAVLTSAVLLCGLATVNFLNSRTSTIAIGADINLINIANQRLVGTMRAYHYIIRAYLRAVGLSPFKTVKDGILDSLYQNVLEMIVTNSELNNEVSQLITQENVPMVYIDDIEFWVYNQSYTLNNGKINTFTATNVLINEFQYISNYTGTLNEFKSDQRILFGINNTVNDYLISSESLITKLQTFHESSTTSDIQSLKIVIGLSALPLILLVITLVYIAIKIFINQRRLLRILMVIDVDNIERRLFVFQKVKQLIQNDIDTRSFTSNAVRFLTASQIRTKRNAKKIQKYENQKGMIDGKELGRKMMAYVSVSIIISVVITGIFISSTTNSISNFKSLYLLNDQLSVTARMEYGVNVFISNFYYETIFHNQTSMLFRNELSHDQLIKNFKVVENLNVDLLSAFFQQEKGVEDPIIQDMLNNQVCQYLPSDSAAYCQKATDGQSIGILSINSNLYLTASSLFTLYMDNPTSDSAMIVFVPFNTVMLPSLYTLEAAYKFLNFHIQSLANNKINSIKYTSIEFYIEILIAITISTLLTILFTLRKLKYIDVSRGKILKIVSVQMIQDNKLLHFYLTRAFPEYQSVKIDN